MCERAGGWWGTGTTAPSNLGGYQDTAEDAKPPFSPPQGSLGTLPSPPKPSPSPSAPTDPVQGPARGTLGDRGIHPDPLKAKKLEESTTPPALLYIAPSALLSVTSQPPFPSLRNIDLVSLPHPPSPAQNH